MLMHESELLKEVCIFEQGVLETSSELDSEKSELDEYCSLYLLIIATFSQCDGVGWYSWGV